jgi:hypothetical protein
MVDVGTELDEINEALKLAEKYNLQAEVVWSALEYMKRHLDATLAEAMEYGLSEWVK